MQGNPLEPRLFDCFNRLGHTHDMLKKVAGYFGWSEMSASKRRDDPKFLWKDHEAAHLLRLFPENDPAQLKLRAVAKVRAEIEGRLLCSDRAQVARDEIAKSISNMSGPANVRRVMGLAADKRVMFEGIRVPRPKLPTAIEEETEVLVRLLKHTRLRVVLPCIELLPCATLDLMCRSLHRRAELTVDFHHPNGSELAKRVPGGSDAPPDILITGMSSLMFNSGLIDGSAAMLSDYQTLFLIHSIQQQCYGTVDSVSGLRRVFYAFGGCTHHFVKECLSRFPHHVTAHGAPHDKYLNQSDFGEQGDAMVAYQPLDEYISRTLKLLPIPGSDHRIYLGCFGHRHAYAEKGPLIETFSRLFRLVYESQLLSAIDVADRLLANVDFAETYADSIGLTPPGGFFRPISSQGFAHAVKPVISGVSKAAPSEPVPPSIRAPGGS